MSAAQSSADSVPLITSQISALRDQAQKAKGSLRSNTQRAGSLPQMGSPKVRWSRLLGFQRKSACFGLPWAIH